MTNMKNELKLIYNTAFDLIELRVNKKEEVLPFVVTIGQDETNPTVGMYEQAVNDTTKQLEVIRNDLRQKIEKGEITSLCLCYNVSTIDPRIKKKTDAVIVELAECNGDSMDIYIPYDINLDQIIQTPFQVPASHNYF